MTALDRSDSAVAGAIYLIGATYGYRPRDTELRPSKRADADA
jgi:hypothetical protein